jgi:hypothetical protein
MVKPVMGEDGTKLWRKILCQTPPTNPNTPPSGEMNAMSKSYQDGGNENVQAEARKESRTRGDI